MSGQEMVVAIVAISCVAAIVLTAMTSIFKLINRRLDSKSDNNGLNKKFFDDYIQFKHQVVDRLERLENSSGLESINPKKNSYLNSGDDDEIIKETSPKLKNMLNQKS